MSVFEQLEFCQTRPLFDGERWRMMRNPLACMKKDGMCLIPIASERTYKRWLGAVGECGLAAASGVPVLQSWYNMFKRAGQVCPRKFKRYIFSHTFHEAFGMGLSGKISEVTDAARVSFYRGTGVTPDMQLAYERLFDAYSLTSKIEPGTTEVYVCKSFPIVDLAPDIFDNTENLTYKSD